MPEILTMPSTVERVGESEESEARRAFGWNVILWNDDVTTIDVVVAALVEVVHLTGEQAAGAALQVHQLGKGIIATVDQTEAAKIRVCLMDRGLTVTLEKVS